MSKSAAPVVPGEDWGGCAWFPEALYRVSQGSPGAPLYAVAAAWGDACGARDWGPLPGPYMGT